MKEPKRQIPVADRHIAIAEQWCREERLSVHQNASRLAVMLARHEADVRADEREKCAQEVEGHLEHLDFSNPQDHQEPPYRCNIAAALRGTGAVHYRASHGGPLCNRNFQHPVLSTDAVKNVTCEACRDLA